MKGRYHPPVTVAGVDLGGTKIQTVVLQGGAVAGSARVPTPERGPDEVFDAIAGTVQSALQESGLSELSAVGIGTPGEIDADAGAVALARNVPGFTDRVELGPQVSKRLGDVAVHIGQKVPGDATAHVKVHRHIAAGAEPIRKGRELLPVLVERSEIKDHVRLGETIDPRDGLVLGGELRTGRGAAGEIGHTVVKHGGRKCSCGRRGCLEAYAGRACMQERARKLVSGGRKTVLFDIMTDKGRDRLTSGVFASALDHGDEMAIELIDDAVWALGVGLASAQNLLDVEAMIVGGGLGDRLGGPFLERIRGSMQPHLFVPDRAPAVLGTELGDLSGAVGAAVLAGG